MGIWDLWTNRKRWDQRVSLWYHPYYEAPSLASIAQSLGMIALRGKRVLASLAKAGLVKAGQLQSFPLVSLQDLELFHSPDYLDRVSRHDALARIFGAHVDEVKVDELLSATRWGVSGTLSAARAVLAGPAPLALNLGGGFHHAEPEMGSGFCVFNDIGVTIQKLRQEGYRENIAIIDLDFHQGNGNVVGFLNDSSVHCYSLHGATWTEKVAPGHFNCNLTGSVVDETYLQALEESLPPFLAKHSPGLAFYIAGHDVLDKDPLGEFHLSLEGAQRRDQRVLQLLRAQDISGVLTLAGGYSLQACQAALDLALAAMDDKNSLTFDLTDELSPKFRRIVASIDPHNVEIPIEDTWSLSEGDLWPSSILRDSSLEIAGLPSAFEVEKEMERSGLFNQYRERGLKDFRISLAPKDGTLFKLEVKGSPLGQVTAPLQTIAKFELSREVLRDPEKLRGSFF